MIIDLTFNYLLFLFKAITVVICFIAILGAISKTKLEKSSQKFKIVSWSNEYSERILGVIKCSKPKTFKSFSKSQKKERKKIDKNLYVIQFNGDILASDTEGLRNFIDCLIPIATKDDKVLIKLESKGGSAPDYGLAAIQLSRIRNAKIPLIISVDKYAASGGYLMACCADRIISTPFAILGSIGVVINIPNFHKLLKNYNIEFNQITAGKYKRTLTPTSPATKDAKDKVQDDANAIHRLFKSFLLEQRPQLDINKVSTGEHWTGHDALKVGLIDELISSDEYILKSHATHNIFCVTFDKKKSIIQKLSQMILQITQKDHKNIMM